MSPMTVCWSKLQATPLINLNFGTYRNYIALNAFLYFPRDMYMHTIIYTKKKDNMQVG